MFDAGAVGEGAGTDEGVKCGKWKHKPVPAESFDIH